MKDIRNKLLLANCFAIFNCYETQNKRTLMTKLRMSVYKFDA